MDNRSSLFDTLLEPVFIINSQRHIVYCNETAANLTEFSSRRIVRGRLELDELFYFDTPIENLHSLDKIKEATPYLEVAFTNSSGDSGKVQITIQPFEINENPTWLIFFRDVKLEETLQKKYRSELEKKENVIKDLQIAQAKLQDYSKNLEKMVDLRTAELLGLNQMLSALLDSLGQGFFIFDKDGLCLKLYSKACERTVESQPSDFFVWDVLKLKENEVPGFKRWTATVFAEMLPFEDLAPLGPITYPHSQGRNINLEYHPLRNEDNLIEGVVVVATDITELVDAQRNADFERAQAKMVLSLVQNRQPVVSFLREAEILLDNLNQQISQKENLNPGQVFQILHTLKGGASSFSIKKVADQCHASETKLTEWKSQPSSVNLTKLLSSCAEIPHLHNSFLKENETIITSRERLKERWIELPLSKFLQFENLFIPPNSPAHGYFLEQFLFEKIDIRFFQYNDVIKTIADRDGKKINPIQFIGGDLKIFPEPYSALLSTLIHAFRNAIDHGIEYPEARLELGKPEAGSIQVAFKREQQFLTIRIQDDGQGVNPTKIREKLTKKGLDSSHETDEQVIQHIFDPDFSTQEFVSETSGRGVGMDAIQSAAKQLDGKAFVTAIKGQGTTLTIEVPWIELSPLQIKKAV